MMLLTARLVGGHAHVVAEMALPGAIAPSSARSCTRSGGGCAVLSR